MLNISLFSCNRFIARLPSHVLLVTYLPSTDPGSSVQFTWSVYNMPGNVKPRLHLYVTWGLIMKGMSLTLALCTMSAWAIVGGTLQVITASRSKYINCYF